MRFVTLPDRRVALGIIVAALAPAFVLTQAVVSRYKRQRQDLADEWTTRGSSDIARHPAAAVADFQTALSFDPTNTQDRFQLAEALIRSSRFAEARAQLLTLWAEEPGNGQVNLELARLAGTDRDVTEAVRYYHAAIDGAWESGASSARREARLELAKLLMTNGQNTRAQAELIAMLDDLPSDASLVTSVGRLLVDAGADARARSVFQRALNVDPHYTPAARSLGRLEYRSGNYRLARDYLQDASRAESLPSTERQELAVSDKVLALDPGGPALTTRERARRVLRDLEITLSRLERCQVPSAADATADSGVSDVAARAEAARRVRERDLARDPDLVDQTMDLVYDIEALPVSACGPPTDDDRALQILAAQRRPHNR